jgi:hypothetical protein
MDETGRGAYRIWHEILWEEDYLQDLDADGRVIFKMNFQEVK